MGLMKLDLETESPRPIEDRLADALEHIKRGWNAAVISAGVTLLWTLASLGGSDVPNPFGLDAWSFVDVALELGLAYGVYRKSRICAGMLIVLLLAGAVITIVEIGRGGFWGTLIFGYFYGQALRGTFVYHSIMDARAATQPVGMPGYGVPGRAPSSSYHFKLALGITGSIILCVVLSAMVYLDTVGPDTAVVPGAQLHERFTTQIRGLDVLEEDETIRFFYSDAIIDIEDGFYLLTDRKVLIYSSTFEEPAVSVPFDEIAAVETEPGESFFTDTQVYLTLNDGDFILFPLSVEKQGDEKFIQALKESLPEGAPSEDTATALEDTDEANEPTPAEPASEQPTSEQL